MSAIQTMLVSFVNSQEPTPSTLSPRSQKSNFHFVSRSGSELLLNGEPFRFAGANISWLGCAKFSGGWAPPPTGVIGPPTKWRIDDAFRTAKAMGCRVIRTFAGTVGSAGTLYPTLGGDLYEPVAASLDYAISKAPYYGLKLIMTLIDYSYPLYLGGIDSFNYWGGTNESGFYNNTNSARDAFLSYVGLLMSRVNIYTGQEYRNDPAIMGWESGNELTSTDSWTGILAAYVKSLAPSQLFIDGKFGVAAASVSNDDVDIVSNHHYPMSLSQLSTDVSAAGGKPLIIGEYDWSSQRSGNDDLGTWLAAIEVEPIIAGSLFWDLSSHGDETGFSADSGDYSNAGAENVGKDYDLRFGESSSTRRTKQALLRTHAENMNGKDNPNIIPGIPGLLQEDSGDLTWRGSAGAWTYTMEKSTTSATSGFTIEEAGLYGDPWTMTGDGWYRVRGVNSQGNPGPYSKVFLKE